MEYRALLLWGSLVCTRAFFSSKPEYNNTSQTAAKTYFYQGICQVITPGVAGQENPKKNSLVCEEIVKIPNWTVNGQIRIGSGNYLAAIRFDEEEKEDGGDDGQLTLLEALTALCDFYSSQEPHSLPLNSGVIIVGKAEIIVYRKAAI